MKLFSLNLAILLVFTFQSGLSQINHGGAPVDLPQYKSASFDEDIILLPAFDQPSEEAMYAEIKASKYKSLKFARSFEVNLNPSNSGNWHNLTNGQRVWRLKIRSENAKSLNIIFSRYHLPEGGMLFVYNPDKSSIRGGFNHFNNKEDGVLPVLPVLGDELLVEYQEPLHADFDAEIEIGTVNHDYMGVMGNYKLGYFGDAEWCHVNVNCDAEANLFKRAVVKMIVGGVELCSGALINTTAKNGRPYVLSAAHCFKGSAYKANTTLFIFNYECPFCSSPGIEGTREQSVAGGTMRALGPTAENEDIDFALAELSVPVPDTYRPVYLGWDITESLPYESYAIHHPVGDVKKIAKDNDPPIVVTLQVQGKVFNALSHFQITQWDSGSTEPGSSGSPLLNQGNQIIGGLSAGLAECTNPKYDYFYRFSKAWSTYPETNRQLKAWLDPLQTGETKIGHYESPAVKKTMVLSNVMENDIKVASTLTGSNTGYQAGHNSLRIAQYAEKYVVSNPFNIMGVYFVPYMGRRTSTNKLKLKIWEGSDTPVKVLYEKDLLINEWVRTQKVTDTNYGQTGGYSTKFIYSHKQNYFNLDVEDLIVDGTFFVGFEMVYPASSVDTFALYQANTNPSVQLNTAYFNDGEAWLPFNSYPGKPTNTSLWIDVVGKTTNDVGILPIDFSDHSYVVFPNPSNQFSASVRISDSILTDTRVMLYSYAGVLLYQGTIPAAEKWFHPDLTGLPSGIYTMVFTSSAKKEVTKLSLIRE